MMKCGDQLRYYLIIKNNIKNDYSSPSKRERDDKVAHGADQMHPST